MAFAGRFFSNLFVIWFCYALYTFTGYYNHFLSKSAHKSIFALAIVLSLIALVFDWLSIKKGRVTYGLKLYVSLKYLFKWMAGYLDRSGSATHAMPFSARKNLLFLLVKIFFIPVMINFFTENAGLLSLKMKDLSDLPEGGISIAVFNEHLYSVLIVAILLIDTGFFTFGYLFESVMLQNRVRSVDTNLLGWGAALACYPPFNGAISAWMPAPINDYATFDNHAATFAARVLMILLMAIYLWATLSLGTRCSNLTNRGIVTTGAYRLVRHPAYISKNIFWWIGLLPVIGENPIAMLGMLFWNAIYLLRAVTEENHLMKDPDYQAYCEVVRYRFVPGVW